MRLVGCVLTALAGCVPGMLVGCVLAGWLRWDAKAGWLLCGGLAFGEQQEETKEVDCMSLFMVRVARGSGRGVGLGAGLPE